VHEYKRQGRRVSQTQSRVSDTHTQSRVFEAIAAGVELILRVVVVIVRVFLAGFLHRQSLAAAIIAALREIVGVAGYTLPSARNS
jgi:membrane protein YdbS with pleckstrin-like domain